MRKMTVAKGRKWRMITEEMVGGGAFRGRKNKSPRKGKRGWSVDLSWDQSLLMTTSRAGQGWKMVVALAVAIAKEGNNGVSGEGVGDSSGRGREHRQRRREQCR
ncbi:hypothetical protein GW17_00036449 [Ensete ventricosum]|nr:hypothetical protein GW17_00036449 [Ensete ventricosum]